MTAQALAPGTRARCPAQPSVEQAGRSLPEPVVWGGLPHPSSRDTQHSPPQTPARTRRLGGRGRGQGGGCVCGRLRPERRGHQALSDAGSGRFSVFPTRMDKATAQRPAPSGLTMVIGHRAKERPPRPTKDMQTSLERCWEKRGCHCGGPWVSPRPAGRSRPPSPPPRRPAGGVILASSDACVGLVFNHEEQSLR